MQLMMLESTCVVNIGYGNMVMATKVVAVLSPDSAPMRRLKEEAKERKMLLDATQGRKTRAIIITDSDHVILSAVQVETLMQRFASRGERMKRTEGLLFVVSAPSGAGKTSLCRAITDSLENLTHSISYTTRKPQAGRDRRQRLLLRHRRPVPGA